LKGSLSTRDGKEFWKYDSSVTSYTQLYTSDSVTEKEVEESRPKGKVSGAELQIKGGLSSTLLTHTSSPEVKSLKVIDLLPKEFESKLTLNGIAWGHSLYYDKDNSRWDTAKIQSDRAIGVLV